MESGKVTLRNREIRRIYREAFPQKERMPFAVMVAISGLRNTEFCAYYEKDAPVGFIYYANDPSLVFVMFLAVDEKFRSKGYGSRIIAELKAKYPEKKLILSVEPCDLGAENYETRLRRRAFYEKNGFTSTGYRMKFGSVQELLIANGSFDKRQFQSFFARYSLGSMRLRIWKEPVPIPRPERQEILKLMYGQGLSAFADRVEKVVYGKENAVRAVFLRDEKGLMTYRVETVCEFDEEEWRYISADSEALPAMWVPQGEGVSFFETIEQAEKDFRSTPEYNRFFDKNKI